MCNDKYHMVDEYHHSSETVAVACVYVCVHVCVHVRLMVTPTYPDTLRECLNPVFQLAQFETLNATNISWISVRCVSSSKVGHQFVSVA